MCLFKRSEEDERKRVKKKVDKLMNQYANEKIDGETYFKKMMKLGTSRQKKRK